MIERVIRLGAGTARADRAAPLTTPPDPGAYNSRTPDAGRRTPDAGRRTPDAGRRTPDAGRRTPDAGRRTPDAGLLFTANPPA